MPPLIALCSALLALGAAAGSSAAAKAHADETCLMQVKSEVVKSAERTQVKSALAQEVKPWLDLSNIWDYEMDAGGLTPKLPHPECSPMPECDEKQPKPKYKPHPMWRPEWWRCLSGGALRAGAFLFLAGILCCAGGIGGGGIYVTVLMVGGNLSVHDAIPLSKVVVFAASTPSLILNLLKTITLKSNSEEKQEEAKTLIDWNLCRIVVPFALMGTLLGVFLNSILPGKLIIGLLVAVLILLMGMLLNTGYQQLKKETEDEAAAALEDSAKPEDPAAPESTSKGTPTSTPAEAKDQGGDAGSAETCRPEQQSCQTGAKGDQKCAKVDEADASTKVPSECEQEREQEPQVKDSNNLGNNEIFYAVSALFTIIYCGVCHFYSAACWKDNYIGQPMCHHPIGQAFMFGQMPAMKQAGWLSGFGIGCMVVAILYCGAIGFFVVKRLVATKQVYGSLHNFESIGHDSMGTVIACYVTMSLLTGSLAGLVGIGGGLIFSPVFIWAKVDPHIAVASSATCVIFTSSSTTFQYLFTDRIIVALIVSFCVPHLAAAYTGTKIVHYIQDNYGAKKSWITWIVALGVGISCILAIIKLFQHHVTE